MRRIVLASGLTLWLVVGTATVGAATPPKDCPAGPNAGEWQSYEINADWEPGDAVPAPGVDEWWDLTLAGIAAEGATPEQVAADFGFATVAELYEAVVLGIQGLDKNADGLVCAKPYKDQHPLPAYFFNAVDNNAREH